MANIISLFNHKGGVSKTTTVFNLGWMLARKDQRVIIVDCDPQCNLTGMVLGFEHLQNVDSIKGTIDGDPLNISEGLAPAFESRPVPIKPIRCVIVPGNDNLLLLPGHIRLAEIEVTLGIAQELSGSLMTLRNLPGSLHHLLNITAEEFDADIVLIDMSPSLGAVNQNLLTTSDFFLIPMNPDYFAMMAIDSLATVLPKWRAWSETAKNMSMLQEAEYPFPDISPKFLGYVIQKYRPRGAGTPSVAFQQWIDQIAEGVAHTLLPALQNAGMVMPDQVYLDAGFESYDPLLQMSDFNALIARSQEHQVPIFELSDEQLQQGGIVLERTKDSMKIFEGLISEAADRVLQIIHHEQIA